MYRRLISDTTNKQPQRSSTPSVIRKREVGPVLTEQLADSSRIDGLSQELLSARLALAHTMDQCSELEKQLERMKCAKLESDLQLAQLKLDYVNNFITFGTESRAASMDCMCPQSVCLISVCCCRCITGAVESLAGNHCNEAGLDIAGTAVGWRSQSD